MRDRLASLLSEAEGLVNNDLPTVEQIADYLIEQGVIVPPFKVGTHVYVLKSKTSNGKNLYLREERIDHYRTFGERSFMCFESGSLSVSNDQWGRDVFLTREGAEKALAERSSHE